MPFFWGGETGFFLLQAKKQKQTKKKGTKTKQKQKQNKNQHQKQSNNKTKTKQTKQKQKQHKQQRQTQDTQKHLNLPNPKETRIIHPTKAPKTAKIGGNKHFNTSETMPDTSKTNHNNIKPSKKKPQNTILPCSKKPPFFINFLFFFNIQFLLLKSCVLLLKTL